MLVAVTAQNKALRHKSQTPTSRFAIDWQLHITGTAFCPAGTGRVAVAALQAWERRIAAAAARRCKDCRRSPSPSHPTLHLAIAPKGAIGTVSGLMPRRRLCKHPSVQLTWLDLRPGKMVRLDKRGLQRQRRPFLVCWQGWGFLHDRVAGRMALTFWRGFVFSGTFTSGSGGAFQSSAGSGGGSSSSSNVRSPAPAASRRSSSPKLLVNADTAGAL